MATVVKKEKEKKGNSGEFRIPLNVSRSVISESIVLAAFFVRALSHLIM